MKTDTKKFRNNENLHQIHVIYKMCIIIYFRQNFIFNAILYTVFMLFFLYLSLSLISTINISCVRLVYKNNRP